MKTRFSFTIDPALLKKAQAAAEKEDRSLSNWLSRLIEDAIKNRGI